MLRKVSRLDVINVSPIKLQSDLSVYYNKYEDKFDFKLKDFEDNPNNRYYKHVFDIGYKKLRFITKQKFIKLVNEKIDTYNHIT